MADAIAKFLAKLTKDERFLVDTILEKIELDSTNGLQLKKLTGHKDVYRVKKGKFRIIYQKTKDDFKLLSITRRNEATYRDF